ncbi:DUF6434 domain-containing protein [Mesorhizobium sp. RIZ17]|uniref:DUF6434 domain-containing protein n=1 Tax=Mesorhizobium sp. RIZ17 TaxID=3132743 RepID=UPI003DA8782E
MKAFDWRGSDFARHGDYKILSQYPECAPLLAREYGSAFRFDRPFMAWLKDGTGKSMGDAADEWLRRQAEKRKA